MASTAPAEASTAPPRRTSTPTTWSIPALAAGRRLRRRRAGARHRPARRITAATGCCWPRPAGGARHHVLLVARRDAARARTPGLHTPIVQLGLRYGMIAVHRLRGDVLRRLLLGLLPLRALSRSTSRAPRRRRSGRRTGIADLRPVRPALPEHHDPAAVGQPRSPGRITRCIEGDRKALIQRPGADRRCSACCFTALQAYEYSDAPFTLHGGGIYPSTFFLATGFHGFHVHRRHHLPDRLPDPRRSRATSRPEQHFGFEAAAWYWHFVDVVWLFLFVCIYWWGAGEIAQH